MAQQIIRSWDALWKMARRAGCTHWNYSRGKLRFRTATKQPYEVGYETRIDGGPPVRVRFYSETDGEFAESGPRGVLFRPPVSTATVPANFEAWPARQQAIYIAEMLETLSAPRFAKQLSPADRILLRIVAVLQKQISAQERRIAELQRRQPEPAKQKPLESQTGRTLTNTEPSKGKEQSDSGLMTLVGVMELIRRVRQSSG